jgi:hypothetical protein
LLISANLSSPSVAYWHLQKLEALGGRRFTAASKKQTRKPEASKKQSGVAEKQLRTRALKAAFSLFDFH